MAGVKAYEPNEQSNFRIFEFNAFLLYFSILNFGWVLLRSVDAAENEKKSKKKKKKINIYDNHCTNTSSKLYIQIKLSKALNITTVGRIVHKLFKKDDLQILAVKVVHSRESLPI